MKSYTDLEQSKKLAEFLPIESADCYWDYDEMQKFHRISWFEDGYNKESQLMFNENNVCAWSLTALLQILPIETYIEIDNVCCTLDISRDTLGKWFVYYHNRSYGSSLATCSSKELLDACYEMIIKLHELNLL